LFTGRQVSKSTTLASKMVLHAVTHPRSSQIYVAPLQDQAEVFSMQRLKDFLIDSPIIRDGFFSGQGMVDQVFRKQLTNSSIIACGYAQRTADRLRGRSVGNLYLDEVQDIMPEVIPVLKEMAFRVKEPSFWYCGTPKTTSNNMEAMRAKSTGNEWAVRCPATGCKKWNYKWTEKNIGNTGIICEYCGQPLNTDHGQWIKARSLDFEKGKDSKVTMESYRIPQLIVRPIMSIPRKWIELLDKLRSYSTELFYNEVLGLPYDSAAQPVTLEQLRKCCNPDRPNAIPNPDDPTVPPLVVSVDWAFVGINSFTVVMVGGWSQFPNKFEVYYYKVYKGSETNPLFQIDDILRIFHQCKARLIAADYGCGQVQNISLVNAVGEDRVAQFLHSGFNASGRKQARAKWEPVTRKWHTARTAVLTDVFEHIKKVQVTFPRAQECDEMFDHILAEALEYNDKSNSVRYVNVNPDDCLHALCYNMLGGELLTRGDFAGHGNSMPIIAGNSSTYQDSWQVDDEFYAS